MGLTLVQSETHWAGTTTSGEVLIDGVKISSAMSLVEENDSMGDMVCEDTTYGDREVSSKRTEFWISSRGEENMSLSESGVVKIGVTEFFKSTTKEK